VIADLLGCFRGCEVTELHLIGSGPPWVLTALDFGDVDALAGRWETDGIEVDNGLLVPAGELVEARPLAVDDATPALVTASVPDEDRGSLQSPGGDDRTTDVLAVLPALPLVEADGLLADLPTAAAGAPPTVPAAEVSVLARADTPSDVLDGLDGEPTTLADASATVDDASGAAQARVYALMAGCCLLVALLVLLTAVARQRDGWRRDAAALRAGGLDPAVVRRSARLEVATLALAAGLAVLAGSVLAIRLLLGELALVTEPAHAVALETGLAVVPLAVVVALTLALVAVVTARGRAIDAGSAPAVLREEAQR
jgi:hypothetical protein